MSETIFLIDGMYLLFSSFYSNRNMRTLKGEPTGAIYGFVTRVESIIRDVQPHRIGVAFDSKEKTFRHQWFEPYKAKRLVPPEELVQQIPLVKEYLALRGIQLFEASGFEADDVIAACSTAEAGKGNDVLIFSADKDLFQLVDDHIFIFHPKLKQKLDASAVKEHFGVSPRQIVDYLSLTGDTSDNIPGVPGIGEKTALKIIEKFQSLDNLLNNLDEADEKIKKKIENNRESLQISRQLIDLANAPEIKEEFLIKPFKDEITPQLLDFYRKLSFSSLLKRFEDTAKTKPEVRTTTLDIKYEIIKNAHQLKQLKEKIREEKYFAFDLETTHLEFFRAEIVGLSISFKSEGYYIPFLYSKADARDITIGFDDFKKELAELFAAPDIKKTGHNLKFDILHLRHHGIEVNGAADDSMVMSYLIHPNRRAHNLKDLTLEFLKYRQVEYDELVGKGKEQKKLIAVDMETLSKYCIDDSYLSLKLVDILGKSIKEKALEDLYTNIEMPLVKILMEMEYAGVRVDVDFLKRAAKTMEEKIDSIEQEIYQMAGYRLNLNSSQQLGELLFEKMNLPVKKKTRKTKSYSTDIEVLNELKEFPIVAKIIDYRTYKKLLSTYLIGLLDSVDNSSRVHSSFNQTVTATGRLSSSDPNLQNIPVGEVAGINVRDAFIAEEGKFLLAADYSQIELRVMAHFSQDPNLLEAFARDFDIHQHTADTVFGDDLFSSPKEKRKRAKIINFSVLYGSGPYSLSKELGVSFKEARNFIDMYYEKHAGVKAFMDEVIAKAEKEPEVKTISGRRRDIPEILSSNRIVKENGKRMAINTVIQGSAADIIKIAMINIHRKMEQAGMKSKLVMQVHDELVFEYPPGEERQLLQIVKEEMENAVELRVPLKVDLETGKTWGSLKKVI
ncbi:MAG: DNA polymerase I [Candidatus Aminicenantes bacterium]|nr:DNA polymerase I [Candidatus Aminicenantes bacterium]NIM77773.1 DNA polymerase I [Candidatus Aminicenantes bacterium]NIN17086.1 DNA polymerase I [Candidatus Aminicenantes bacterium]NIN40979.1 DNA polymerase I [Candidatus Aminicenantes bacterium]NIN83784.1 DNA polymerase I [Candidatus Aminicenantes bacterium]